ncbi:hypothetical protein [Kocuria palustris]|uniref:hypothetical protein n=1 Tax=Kocuria palustris TaxID=71999 RepID=UPI00204331A0|nr:hypothetical protein [Kocuria palustris]MCM3331399.1 hypothetical protein [Kocuria palustris]
MEIQPLGSNEYQNRVPHTGELFADRESESKAFKTALSSFRWYLDSIRKAGNDRHNVLTFYGLGGIGKTALSERLEAWVNQKLPLSDEWGLPPGTEVRATARIDLHGSAGQMNVLAALLALRAGVAKLRPRWPVFDLAFAAYWSAARPGEPLPKFRGDDELNDAVVGILRDSLTDLGTLADLAGTSTGAGFGVAGVRKLISELRRRRDLQLGIDAFPGFKEFLERCGNEPNPTEPRLDLACKIAGLLAWEISRMTPCPLVVVFVDTTERLALDPRRTSEGYLNSLVHQMPNVLFVLTGRDMLDWFDLYRTNLPHRGKETWPGLIPGAQEDPRQHLVGNLSAADTKTVILRGRHQLNLPMSDEVVDELVKASAGLPQYLELARQVAISIKNSGEGRSVEIADVTSSLGELVERVLEDIPPDEQRALRGACLFRLFDINLMAAAADVDHGCAERAASRPMIDHHQGEQFPYRMHDAVREAIRTSDHRVTGGWSEKDWQLAASRAAVTAQRMHKEAETQENSRGILDAISIAINLVCDQEVVLGPSDSDTYADWLSRAIVFAPSIQGLRSSVPATSKTEYGQHVLNFIASKSIDAPIDDRLRLLRSIFDSNHPLRLAAGRHLGYALRTQYRWGEALAVFDELIALAPTPLHISQRPKTLSLARKFDDAKKQADGTPADENITRLVDYAHGRPELYFSIIENKLIGFQKSGRYREYLEDKGDYLVRRSFFLNDTDVREINEFLQESEAVGHIVGIRSALLATVLNRRFTPEEISAALERLRELDRTSIINRPIGFRYAWAEFCDAQLNGAHDRLARLHKEISHIKSRSRPWIPIECFLETVGLPLPQVFTQWLEPREIVVKRWAGHLHHYLSVSRENK